MLVPERAILGAVDGTLDPYSWFYWRYTFGTLGSTRLGILSGTLGGVYLAAFVPLGTLGSILGTWVQSWVQSAVQPVEPMTGQPLRGKLFYF